MQDLPAVGRCPWFVSFPLVYQASAWPNQCRIHSFWMTMYICIYIYARSLFSSSTANQWLLVVFGRFQSLSQSDCYDWFLLKMIAPNNGRFLIIDNIFQKTFKNQWFHYLIKNSFSGKYPFFRFFSWRFGVFCWICCQDTTAPWPTQYHAMAIRPFPTRRYAPGFCRAPQQGSQHG